MFYGSHTVMRDGAGKVPVATESRPVPIDPKFAEYSHEHLDNSFISWLHFQTMLYEINEEEPD